MMVVVLVKVAVIVGAFVLVVTYDVMDSKIQHFIRELK